MCIFPSAQPDRGLACANQWLDRGYEVLIMLDHDAALPSGPNPRPQVVNCDGPFRGYYQHISDLARTAFERGADLVSAVGDDMLPPSAPDQNAQRIAEVYFSRFGDGYGVLQGTGDIQGADHTGHPAAARICGSPTFGRGWLERGYSCGPFWNGYASFFADEDLWNRAKNAGVLWLEPSITILHKHWSWGWMKRQHYHERAQLNWQSDYLLFQERMAQGFPA